MKTYYSLTTRRANFFVDASQAQDKKKLTVLIPNHIKGTMEPVAEIPIMSRTDIIKFLNRLGAYLDARYDLDTVPHEVKYMANLDQLAKSFAVTVSTKEKAAKKGQQVTLSTVKKSFY